MRNGSHTRPIALPVLRRDFERHAAVVLAARGGCAEDVALVIHDDTPREGSIRAGEFMYHAIRLSQLTAFI